MSTYKDHYETATLLLLATHLKHFQRMDVHEDGCPRGPRVPDQVGQP